MGALVTTLCTELGNDVAVNGTDTTMLVVVVVGDCVTVVDCDCVIDIITGVVVASVVTEVFVVLWTDGLSIFNCNYKHKHNCEFNKPIQ